MPVPEDFDFDAWADDARNKPVERPVTVLLTENPVEFEKPQPEPAYDPREDFESLLETITEEIHENEGVRLSIGREAIWAFASRIWDAAEDATAYDMAQCCGCSGSDKELNPFKERRESDE